MPNYECPYFVGFEQNLGRSQIWQNWSLEFCEIQLTELSNILVKYGYAEFRMPTFCRIWKLNLGSQIRQNFAKFNSLSSQTYLSAVLLRGWAFEGGTVGGTTYPLSLQLLRRYILGKLHEPTSASGHPKTQTMQNAHRADWVLFFFLFFFCIYFWLTYALVLVTN